MSAGPPRTTEHQKRLRKQFGMWIKRLREASELTQKDVSEALGHGYLTTLSQYERGIRPVPMNYWPILANLYHMKPKEFAMRALKLSEPDVFYMIWGSDQED